MAIDILQLYVSRGRQQLQSCEHNFFLQQSLGDKYARFDR